MLLVLVQQVVEYFLVQEGDPLEVIAAPRLEAHNLIDQTVRFMRKIRDVLLPLHLLSHVCRVITDLELDRV